MESKLNEEKMDKAYDYLLKNNTGTLYNPEIWVKELLERAVFHLTEDECKIVIYKVNATIKKENEAYDFLIANNNGTAFNPEIWQNILKEQFKLDTKEALFVINKVNKLNLEKNKALNFLVCQSRDTLYNPEIWVGELRERGYNLIDVDAIAVIEEANAIIRRRSEQGKRNI